MRDAPIPFARFVAGFAVALAVAAATTAELRAQSTPLPTAELRFFTHDGTATGTPLLPGLLRHSCWSALGVSDEGGIYAAISNHQQPGGNVGLYRYDPVADSMTTLGDIRGISTAQNNWMPNESQYKVHTLLLRDGEGRLWFASDDHTPTPFLRGAHVYHIDTATDLVTDYSKTQPMLLTRAMQAIPNTGQPAERSGIFVEYYGIKGMALNPRAADVIYAITFPDGHVLRHDRSTGAIARVAQAEHGAFLGYVDNRGDFYFETVPTTGRLAIHRYERATGTVTTVADVPGVGIGAVAPTSCGEVVYWLVADTKRIYRYDCRTGQFVEVATACGSNWWRLYNLSLSPNGEALYYVSNNNTRSVIRRIDLISGACTEVLDVNTLLGTRDLCFGGMNVWDRAGRLYAGVWTFSAPLAEDVALLRAGPFDPALAADTDTLSVATGGTQTLRLAAGPDHGGRDYLVLGSITGASGERRYNDLRLPLPAGDVYFDFTLRFPGQPPLTDGFGTLDGNGRATATFTLPPGLGALLGLDVHHAFAVLDPAGEVLFTSNAVKVTLVR